MNSIRMSELEKIMEMMHEMQGSKLKSLKDMHDKPAAIEEIKPEGGLEVSKMKVLGPDEIEKDHIPGLSPELDGDDDDKDDKDEMTDEEIRELLAHSLAK